MRTKVIFSILGLLFSMSLFAQVDRSKAPEPAAAPKIQIGKYQSFELDNGLKVYVVENHKIPRVAFSLTLDVDPIMEGDKAGYVSMTGQLLRSGTTNKTKAELDEEIDFIGASLSTSAHGVYAASLTKHTDKLLDLMTDVLFHPAFSNTELEKIRKQTLSSLAASKENPNAIAGNVTDVLVYGKNHPYGEITTEETVENITVEDASRYYATYFKPNVAYLAVVGDIKFKQAKKLVNKYFSDWEKGDVPTETYPVPESPAKTYVAMVDRSSSVQSVINVSYPVNLKPGQTDGIQARVMNQILGGSFSSRLMQNLREDKAYTYGARSSISSDELVGDFTASASVRNEVTDSAVFEFLKELKKIRNEEVKQTELDAAKASIIGSFARSLEEPSTIASFAINTARYNLPEDYYANYLKNVSATTLNDVKMAADKYITPDHANIVVVGKASEVADKLSQFGEVKYFDIKGEEYDPAIKATIPEGLTGQKVIDNYIKVIGGKEKLESVKTLTSKMTADMMGRSLELEAYKKAPNKFLMEIKMAGSVISKQLVNGDNIEVSQMGNKVPLDENSKEELLLEASLFPELNYVKSGVKAELTGVEKIDGTEAYAIKLTSKSGNSFTLYFDTKTGYKIRQVRVVKAPQGEMELATDFQDYKEVSGIKFPFTMVQPMGGGMKLNVETSEIKVNDAIPDSKFQ